MATAMKIKSSTELMVVETMDDWYLGTIEVDGDIAVIYTGLRGRPKVLSIHEIDSVTPAAGHPSVEEVPA